MRLCFHQDLFACCWFVCFRVTLKVQFRFLLNLQNMVKQYLTDEAAIPVANALIAATLSSGVSTCANCSAFKMYLLELS